MTAPASQVQPWFSLVLPGDELTLDGSAGEGGGQILRSALTLSMLTGTPFVLERIRAGRERPGLMRQHLTCVRAAAICGAQLEGAELHSTRLQRVLRDRPTRRQRGGGGRERRQVLRALAQGDDQRRRAPGRSP